MIAVSAVSVQVGTGDCYVNPVLVAVPVKSLSVTALAPLSLTSCVLTFPRLDSTGGSIIPPPGAWVPVAPGVGALPPSPTIVDTSPDRLLGCVNGLEGSPQIVLNALFPAAITGDGVVDKETSDFWVYDGSTWENVGPNPGPTVVEAEVLPVWGETVLLSSVTKTRLTVESFPYRLELQTDLGEVQTRTVLSIIPFTKIDCPSSPGITVSALSPAFEARQPVFGKVVHPVKYTTPGSSLTINLPWDTNFIWISYGGPSTPLWPISFQDDLYWGWTNYSGFFALNGEIILGDKSFTVTNGWAGGGTAWCAWAFKGSQEPLENTNGSIVSEIRESECFTIVNYTGNGLNGATVGHGLDEEPAFIMIKPLTGSWPFVAISGLIGYQRQNQINGNGQFFYSGAFNGADSNLLTLGSSSHLNGNGSNYLAYCFKNVPGLSKVGLYVGNGLPSGKFVDCGFEVGFLFVKGVNVSNYWAIVDFVNNANGDKPLVPGWSGFLNSESFTLEGNGFTANYDAALNPSTELYNAVGATYIYMAFARGGYKTIPAGSVGCSVAAPLPLVSGGCSVACPAIAVNVEALPAPYIGVAAGLIITRSTGATVLAPAPLVASGARADVPLATCTIVAKSPVYVGEVVQETLDYIEIVEYSDGELLEDGVKTAILNLMKALKAADLLTKLDMLVPMVGPRILESTFIALWGLGFVRQYAPSTGSFNYNRETGVKQSGGNTGELLSAYGTLNASDNHVSLIATENGSFGGDIFGLDQRSNVLITKWHSQAYFQTRNFNYTVYSGSNFTWSAPVFFGMSRSASGSYISRTNGTNTTHTAGVTDTGSGPVLVRPGFYNGRTDMRLAMLTAGKSLDLSVLEPILRQYVTDVQAAL